MAKKHGVKRYCTKCGDELGSAWTEPFGVRICRDCLEFWATGIIKNNRKKEKRLILLLINECELMKNQVGEKALVEESKDEIPDNICHCGQEMVEESCHACFGEGGFHDCGEDTCVCLDKSPNIMCEDCNGKGSYLVCPNAEQHWKDSQKGGMALPLN